MTRIIHVNLEEKFVTLGYKRVGAESRKVRESIGWGIYIPINRRKGEWPKPEVGVA